MSYASGTHYPKIKRLPLYPVPYRKDVLSDTDIELLFGDEVVAEEKIDGEQKRVDCGNYVIFYEYTSICV